MTVLDFAFGYLHEGGAKPLIKGDKKILGRLSLITVYCQYFTINVSLSK